MFPKIIKHCPICDSIFETRSGSPLEKKFCSKKCFGVSIKVEDKSIKQNEKRREKYATSEVEREKRLNSSKEYSLSHRQELNAYSKEYRKNNPDLLRSIQKRARLKLKENNPEHLIWMETKKRAFKKNIPFDIDVSDIIIPKVCPILGIELSFGIGKVHDESPSLDRIVPEKGYVKGNCFIISSKANRMKQENTLETLQLIINYIKERL